MATIIVRSGLTDYEKWETIFTNLKAYGWVGNKVFLNPSNYNTTVIVNSFTSPDRAKTFTLAHELQEAMQKAGVSKLPEILFLSDDVRW